MNIDSIIFDVDGTLWDTTEVVANAWNKAVAELGIEREPITADRLKKEFGKPMDIIADNLFPKESKETKEKIMEACCVEEHRLLEACEDNLLYPMVKETMIKLAGMCRVCVVSNCQSGYIELFLKKNGLEEYVTDIECFGNTNKSKGENIKAVVERNHLQNSIYVGDTQGDYNATVEAGVPFVFVKYGFGNVEGDYKEIEEIDELLSFV